MKNLTVRQRIIASFLAVLLMMGVANGLEVLQALETKNYDLILLDVQMPEMDGYEAAKRIRLKWVAQEAQRPRIVAMTGNAMLGDRERCLEAGMDDYVSKPVRVEELTAALKKWGLAGS